MLLPNCRLLDMRLGFRTEVGFPFQSVGLVSEWADRRQLGASVRAVLLKLDCRTNCIRRECVEQLLTKGADSLAYNGDLHLPCDMTESRSPVWGVLEHDMQWRTALQARAAFLPCIARNEPRGGGAIS